uniref:Uncharacterized protein n=1 Tax=Oryza brachyantha TaxID=4533 RepID=J3LZH9_ORYBR
SRTSWRAAPAAWPRTRTGSRRTCAGWPPSPGTLPRPSPARTGSSTPASPRTYTHIEHLAVPLGHLPHLPV